MGNSNPPGSPTALAPGLDPACPQPLYSQLAERLAAQISSGHLPPGAQLPTETALMTMYGVSRITVRQAITLLARNGQVVARRGKGTFVSRPVLQHDLGFLQGFQDALRRQGVEPQTELLEWSPHGGRTDPSLPEALDLPVRLRRCYRLDQEPFAVVEAYLPAQASTLGETRAAQLTVYDILQQFLGLTIARAEVVVRCAIPPARVGRELEIKGRTNVLVMERTSRTPAGVACEFMRIFIVPERYAFQLSLPGPLDLASALHPMADPVSAATQESKPHRGSRYARR